MTLTSSIESPMRPAIRHQGKRAFRETQITYRALATQFSVSGCAISNIVNGKRWKGEA